MIIPGIVKARAATVTLVLSLMLVSATQTARGQPVRLLRARREGVESQRRRPLPFEPGMILKRLTLSPTSDLGKPPLRVSCALPVAEDSLRPTLEAWRRLLGEFIFGFLGQVGFGILAGGAGANLLTQGETGPAGLAGGFCVATAFGASMGVQSSSGPSMERGPYAETLHGALIGTLGIIALPNVLEEFGLLTSSSGDFQWPALIPLLSPTFGAMIGQELSRPGKGRGPRLSNAASSRSRQKHYVLIGGNSSFYRGRTNGSRSGFTVGVGHEWQLSRRASIAEEVLYAQRRGFVRATTEGPSWDHHFVREVKSHSDLRLLEIPFSFRYRAICERSFSIFLSFGVALSMPIAETASEKVIYSTEPWGPRLDYHRIVHRDFGDLFFNNSGVEVTVGAGFAIWRFRIECRYTHALTAIERPGSLSAFDDKLDGIHFLVGIML